MGLPKWAKPANLLFEVVVVTLGLICWLPAISARAQQYSRGNPLIGKWSGYRPTDGYIYEIRYQLEFLSDGTYHYVARQVSPKRRLWKIEHHGRFTMARSDSKYWQAILVLVPDAGSASPPTEADRKALVDELGLPDNKPRNFRVRKESFRDGFDFQLTDADPSDGVEQVWYLARSGE
jgi:hypothetical protein